MAATFQLDIVTPERKVFSGDVTFVSVKGMAGDLGIMANHMPLVTPLKIGPVKIVSDVTGEKLVAVSGGFIEVRGSKVTILAETAELPEEIDIDRAMRAKERAEQRLAKRNEFDQKRAELALARAITRITVGRSGK
jgi:F-type H+-transporting ATPase subunit epsilon